MTSSSKIYQFLHFTVLNSPLKKLGGRDGHATILSRFDHTTVKLTPIQVVLQRLSFFIDAQIVVLKDSIKHRQRFLNQCLQVDIIVEKCGGRDKDSRGRDENNFTTIYFTKSVMVLIFEQPTEVFNNHSMIRNYNVNDFIDQNVIGNLQHSSGCGGRIVAPSTYSFLIFF